MFAIVFLAVIVFGVTKLQTSNLVLSKTNVNEADAYFLANQGVEIVEGLGYDVGTCPAPGPCVKALRLSGSGSYELFDAAYETVGVIFKRSLIFEPAGLTNAYKVTSRITWTDSLGDHVCDATYSNCVEVKRIVF